MRYSMQATKPDWYQSDQAKTYTKAIFGTSPYNEWYEFTDRAEAVEHFSDQISIDYFHWIGGEIFHMEDLYYDDIHENFINPSKATPADLGVIAQSVSKF